MDQILGVKPALVSNVKLRGGVWGCNLCEGRGGGSTPYSESKRRLVSTLWIGRRMGHNHRLLLNGEACFPNSWSWDTLLISWALSMSDPHTQDIRKSQSSHCRSIEKFPWKHRTLSLWIKTNKLFFFYQRVILHWVANCFLFIHCSFTSVIKYLLSCPRPVIPGYVV